MDISALNLVLICSAVFCLFLPGCSKPGAHSPPAKTSNLAPAPQNQQRLDKDIPIESDPALVALQKMIQPMGGSIRKYSAPPSPDISPSATAQLRIYVDVQLAGETITDSQIKDVAEQPGFQQVTSLNVRGSRISDESLKQIARGANIEMLDLSRTQVTDKGLEYLKGHKRLQYLVIDESQITHSGLDNLLRGLPALTDWWQSQGNR